MTDIETQLQNEQQAALESLEQVEGQESLDTWKQTHLGKSSLMITTFGKMSSFSKEERPLVGRAVNLVPVTMKNAYAL